MGGVLLLRGVWGAACARVVQFQSCILNVCGLVFKYVFVIMFTPYVYTRGRQTFVDRKQWWINRGRPVPGSPPLVIPQALLLPLGSASTVFLRHVSASCHFRG
eukprot:3874054-Pyramimonas_sp.AAC.1